MKNIIKFTLILLTLSFSKFAIAADYSFKFGTVSADTEPLLDAMRFMAKNIEEKSKIVHLSTDSKKIINISKKYYKINDDLRPKKLARDESLDIDFLNYTLYFYSKKNILFKYCIILRPTNPIRKKKL